MSEEKKIPGLRADAPPFLPTPTIKRLPSEPSPGITITPVVTDTYDYYTLSKPMCYGEYYSLSEIIKISVFYECLLGSCLNKFEGFEPVFKETIPPEIIINFILRDNEDTPIRVHISFHPQSMVGNTTHLKFGSDEIQYKFVNIPEIKILRMEETYRTEIINEKINSQINEIIFCINEILRINYDMIIIYRLCPLNPEFNEDLKYKTEQYNNYLTNYNNLTSYIAYVQGHSTLSIELKTELIRKYELKIQEITQNIIIKLKMYPADFFNYINSIRTLPKSSTIGYFKKYIKYKNKYLNLKNKLNNYIIKN